jgi:D-serine deaminase-like pyridoxal phosphate-dependent protein
MIPWPEWRDLLADRPLPAAVVDLDALDRNVDRIVAALGSSPATIRVASKSVRHAGLLRRIVARGNGRIRGVLAYAAREVELLAEAGFTDVLLAYPVARRDDARVLADLAGRGVRCVVAVDDPHHVAVLGEAARERGVVIPLCVDVDLSWRPVAGAHLGVRRSPIRGGDGAVRLARAVADTGGVELVAVMAYEAQIAGVRDANPGSRLLDPVRALVKRGSRPLATARRKEVVDALHAAGFALSIVNGGGTGSIAFTAADPVVTEVAAGSGFLCPHLFDGYAGLALEPAAFFAIPVARRSDPGFVTCAGGGYPASGAAGPDRLPTVHLPVGLEPVGLEGWGEVQTPFRWRGPGEGPALGDPVLCRHAKAGELAERFATMLLFRGGRLEAEEPTWRGQGAAFG